NVAHAPLISTIPHTAADRRRGPAEPGAPAHRSKRRAMCLIAVAWRATGRRPLIVAANRDESHARPTEPAHWWPDAPRILAGRDALAGGTWLGVDAAGRFAAVTNLRGAAPLVGQRSRGTLVADF